MKNSFIIFFLILITTTTFSYGQTTSVMTYNIRYDTQNDGENWWKKRKSVIVDLIQNYQPEIFGTQEGKLHQIHYLDSCLTKHSYIGVGRDDGKLKGEFSAIFYDSTKYTVSQENTFWLSEDSNNISVGWDASMERICTYGLFKNKISGKELWVFNTHYDHIGVQAREMSSKLILSKIKEVNKRKLPVVLMGDFNSSPNSIPIQSLTKELKDSYVESKKNHIGPVGTFNGFDSALPLDNRIDYIFIQNLSVETHIHINDKRPDGYFISDHLPVLTSLQF